jgi:hypothetical protein
MGYLRHRISRHRCAAQKADAISRQASAGLDPFFVASAALLRLSRRRSYLRFAVGRIEPATQRRLGIFKAAGHLRESGGVSAHEMSRLKGSLRWFNSNLKVPRVPHHAVFWFKSDASCCMERVWEIVRLLKAHDHIVWMMRAEELGQVVYEDAQQMAAVATGTRMRRCRPV